MRDRARNLSSIYRSPDTAGWTVVEGQLTGPWWGAWLDGLGQDRTMQAINGRVLYMPVARTGREGR